MEIALQYMKIVEEIKKSILLLDSYYLCKKIKHMKRILGILIVSVALTLAMGCGEQEEPQPQQKTPPPIQQ